MDLIPLGNEEYSIYGKGRVDGGGISGYMGTRSQDKDNLNIQAGYVSATGGQISRWKLIPYDDGYLI